MVQETCEGEPATSERVDLPSPQAQSADVVGSTGEPAVVTESLTHSYGSRVALDGVNLSVARGCLFGLLGPNGGGKTTLFRILSTLLTPTSGSVKVAGFDAVNQRHAVRQRIGVVFQSPSLDGHLTVAENLEHQGHLYGLSGRALLTRIAEVLERFSVLDRADERVAVLSGGLARRVEVAKALLHQPEVLILDEPGTGLDPRARATMMSELRRLCDDGGVTVLLTTHLMDEAGCCDTLGILDEGRLVTTDTPAALKRLVGGEVVSITTANPEAFAATVSKRYNTKAQVVGGVVRIERERGHEFVPELVEAYPGEIESVTVGHPTLADVFVHLTGHGLYEERSRDDGA